MVEEKFRLPLSSYEQLARIIKAYGSMDRPASPDEVGKSAAMHSTIVSRNNAFLVIINVLERGQKKQLTERGRALALALDHNRADEIRRLWRDIVSENEFLQKLVTAVKIREGMETSTLQAHIAYSAGEPRRAEVMTGAAAIVDILKTAGLLAEQDGKLIAVSEEMVPGGKEIAPESPAQKPTPTISKSAEAISATLPQGMSIQIQVQIQCSADEIEGLAEKIQRFLDRLYGAPHSSGE